MNLRSCRSDNVERLRELNFGIRTHTLPVASSTITSQLAAYSASDTVRVSSWMRERSSVGDAVRHLIEIYTEAVNGFDPAAIDRREAAQATGRFFSEATGEFHRVMNERDAVRQRARADAHGQMLQVRAQGERNNLREQLAQARSDLTRERCCTHAAAADPPPTGCRPARSTLVPAGR